MKFDLNPKPFDLTKHIIQKHTDPYSFTFEVMHDKPLPANDDRRPV